MKSNRAMGNAFEQELCNLLFNNGFWVHPLTQDSAGQPADILAVRNGKAYLIDAKVCSNNTFPLSRVEENQDLAMDLWKESGNGIGWFALKLGGEVYMLSHYVIKAFTGRQKALSVQDIFDMGIPFEKWVKKCK